MRTSMTGSSVSRRRFRGFAGAWPDDLRRKRLPREKVLAAVVKLLETTLVRVGNDEYAEANKSFGLTTMRDRHATRYARQDSHGVQR